MSTLRFAIVAPNFYPRTCGVGDHSARLGSELRRRGHEVRLFSRVPAERHPEAPELEVQGVAGAFPIQIALAMRDALRAFRPTDVIIQFTAQMWDAWRFGSPAQIWLAAAARRMGARTSVIAHELYVPWRPRPDLFLAAGLQRLQLIGLLRNSDRAFVTTQTRATRVSRWISYFGLPSPALVRVGPNALPLPSAEVRKASSRGRGPRIGFFSTMNYGKRFDVVLTAFERIAHEFPEAELVLMGDIGSRTEPKVRALFDAIAAQAARDRIAVTGKLGLSEIAARISELDLYLFPMDTGANTRSGTLPVALGSGIPIVATRGPETDALFQDGVNISFADELSGPSFAERALQILRHPALASRIGRGAAELYRDHLAWERIADEFLAAL